MNWLEALTRASAVVNVVGEMLRADPDQAAREAHAEVIQEVQSVEDEVAELVARNRDADVADLHARLDYHRERLRKRFSAD